MVEVGAGSILEVGAGNKHPDSHHLGPHFRPTDIFLPSPTAGPKK